MRLLTRQSCWHHIVEHLMGLKRCAFFSASRRWIATLGIILAISRAFVQESGVAYEPEEALTEVVMHTHYLPRHWRGRAHTREVQEQFQQLFQFKVRCC